MYILNELLLAGAAQGVLLGVVILSLGSSNTAATRLLAAIVALESLHLFFLYLSYSFGAAATPLLFRSLFGLRVLDAPALYLYVCALTDARFRFQRSLSKHLWVLLPVTALLLQVGTQTEWRNMSTTTLQYEHSTMLWSMYHSSVFIGYGLLASRRLSQHLRRLRHAVASLEIVGLHWLQRLVIAVIAAHFVHIGFDVLRLQHVLGAEPKIVLNLIATLAVIYWLSIGGLRQQVIFTESMHNALAAIAGAETGSETENEAEGGRATAEAVESHNKYAKSGLDDARSGEIWRRLQSRLSEQQPFLDAQLDLPSLARQLDLRPQELSQVINSHSGGSFYDLINNHRIEAAKTLLRSGEGQRRKMLDIALSVGFSSQSTFYHQFKKLTGVTPTRYRDQPLEPSA